MGKKLESNFKNMVLVLFGVTLVASAAVGAVNAFTADRIAQAQLDKQVEAIRQVVAPFDNDPMAEADTLDMPDGGQLIFYPATQGGQPVGTAVKTYTNNGFSGFVSIMVGFNPDGAKRPAPPVSPSPRTAATWTPSRLPPSPPAPSSTPSTGQPKP